MTLPLNHLPYKGFKESTGNATQINDFYGNTVELFLKFIYGENLLKENFTPELLLIAEKYDVKNLIQECKVALIKTIDSENVLELLKVAFLTNQKCLMTKARDFLIKNPSVFISDNWGQIVQAHPSLCKTLNQLNFADDISNVL